MKKSDGNNGILKGLVHPRTFGQKAADWIAKWAGSWTFILSFLVVLTLWMFLNTSMVLLGVWDKYPFILLNLVLSCIAALQAPVILMSQNRQSQKDRIKVEYDYRVNRKAERYIEQILKSVKKVESSVVKKK
jgi:uncharacterized membrane protein